MKFANLHLHSIYSDGQFTPSQLILIGKCLGYKAMALTDHETHGGVNLFLAAAKEEGIDAIPGIEFYGNDFGGHFHICALDFDMNDPGINRLVKQRCDAYIEYTRKCFERALRLGYIHDVTWNDVLDYCEDGMWICVDQVWNLLKKKKIIPQHGESPELRAKVYMEPEPRSFYPEIPSAVEVIKIIRAAGGIAALAHPYRQTHYVPKLVEEGLNGIEISHPHVFEDARLAVEAADTYKLYRSGGTDHTGALSGCNGVNAVHALHGITEEEYFIMKERRLD